MTIPVIMKFLRSTGVFCLLLPVWAAGQTVFNERDPSVIALSNDKISVGFDRVTGALVLLQNKAGGDNYLKAGKGGNLFRIFPDPMRGPSLSADVYKYRSGNGVWEPGSGKLKEYTYRAGVDGGELSLTYLSPDSSLVAALKMILRHQAAYIDCSLDIWNASAKPREMYASFPYLSGLQIGDNSSDHLTIDMWDRGYPGVEAWKKALGGIYGREASMQWQCVYKPHTDRQEAGEGMAFMVMDTSLKNKILGTFPGGGMQAFYFDRHTLGAGQVYAFPPVRLQVFSGSWRKAAENYDAWFRDAMSPRSTPDWYRSVGMRGSGWFPPPGGSDPRYPTLTPTTMTSYRDLFMMYADRYDDVIEFAQWNDEIRQWPETYGPWMSSGLLGFREDLGGEAAFREGVRKVHEAGRRVAMYVAGYGIRTSSPIFQGDSWKQWAIEHENGTYNYDYREGEKIHGVFVCPGYKPWQDHIISVCKRLARTGIDEIRLDELGFPFKSCYNAHHGHSSPHDANRWMKDYLHRVRMAMDSINPELVITTEYFVDYFSQYTNGALVMDYSGKEIDAMKVAMPHYLPLSYHAGAAEAVITGAVPGKATAQRKDWAWTHVGSNPIHGYGTTPDVEMKWHNLFLTFAPALVYGKVHSGDPVAVKDSLWSGHLWETSGYALVTGGYDDARPVPGGKVEVIIPRFSGGKFAYELNLVTGKVSGIESKERADGKRNLVLSAPVSAVFFPKATCPALPVFKEMKPAKGKLSVTVGLLSEWTPASVGSSDLRISAPGFRVSRISVKGKTLTFDLQPEGERPPGNYYFRVEGKVLPLRHWFRWE